MKFKLAVPRNVLTQDQIDRLETKLSGGLVGAVTANFPNWVEKAKAGKIAGGEIILQDTDMTKPIKGLRPGIHVTISLVSYQPGRNYDGLARSVMRLLGRAAEDDGRQFMSNVRIFVQMSLDMPVIKTSTGKYTPSTDGRALLEYEG